MKAYTSILKASDRLLNIYLHHVKSVGIRLLETRCTTVEQPAEIDKHNKNKVVTSSYKSLKLNKLLGCVQTLPRDKVQSVQPRSIPSLVCLSSGWQFEWIFPLSVCVFLPQGT